MVIKSHKVLILGGWGLVGSAICRRLVEEDPKQLIVTSLLRSEAEEAVAQLRKEYPRKPKNFFLPAWGNLFVRQSLKDTPRDEILNDEQGRMKLIDDMLGELNEEVIQRSTIYQLVHKHRPEIIVDCINSATAIAYQDIFQSARDLLKYLRAAKTGIGQRNLTTSAEKLLCSLYTPQLIRHVQVLYRSMHSSGTRMYVKIGTSGTGGMGLNIPYTHSEERPSSVLLSKSAVAGAQTMLLFLMGRTPDAPITKEVKPTAAIAWKRVGYGEIQKRGKPIELVDCPPSKGTKLRGFLNLTPQAANVRLGKNLTSVFIDTGENGTFSRGEFEAIATPGQMEFVTPEEIAETVVYEIKGGNTGHDIINALDNATLSPTYRAGYLFHPALSSIKALEQEHKVDSVAFELLGPPRLSKLLYEAYLLKMCFKDMRSVLRATPANMSKKLLQKISSDVTLRSQIISIGIPILLPDGKTLLRGDSIKIPPYRGESEIPITPRNINTWAHDGWVDLRTENMNHWKSRFKAIIDMISTIPPGDSSSRFLYTKEYWNDFNQLVPGKLAGWIFSYEEKGMRMKA